MKKVVAWFLADPQRVVSLTEALAFVSVLVLLLLEPLS
jgi:hypothetical protein